MSWWLARLAAWYGVVSFGGAVRLGVAGMPPLKLAATGLNAMMDN
jgi:hypothetical protein